MNACSQLFMRILDCDIAMPFLKHESNLKEIKVIKVDSKDINILIGIVQNVTPRFSSFRAMTSLNVLVN